MATICENHYISQATSRLVCEIVFAAEFASLCEELSCLYRKYNLENPDQEAFSDAFYCLLTQQETRLKAISY